MEKTHRSRRKSFALSPVISKHAGRGEETVCLVIYSGSTKAEKTVTVFHQKDIHDMKLCKTINQKILVPSLVVQMNLTSCVKKNKIIIKPFKKEGE